MSDEVYKFMSKREVLWCCDQCSEEIRKSLNTRDKSSNEEPKANKTEETSATAEEPTETADPNVKEDIKNMRRDLDETIGNMKLLFNEFYSFMNGNRNQRPEPQNSATAAQTNRPTDVEVTEATDQDNNRMNQPRVWNTIPQVKKSFGEILKEAQEESRREAEEETRRRKNIIIHRAPESTSEDPDTRRKADMDTIQSLLQELGVTAEVLVCYRLGEKPKNQDKQGERTRPLKVIFDSEHEVNNILRSLSKLRNAEDEMKKLRVTPDRNMREREEVRSLVNEAKNRTALETGDYVHIVKGKEIIRVKARKAQAAPTRDKRD
jgi:hypothetical protein